LRKAAIALLLLIAAAYGLLQLSRATTFQLFGEIVPRVETDRRVVALTFDDGPTPEVVDEMLAILAKHDVKATFFVIGGELEEHPEAAAKIVRAGHELGNHSYSHVRLVFKSPSFIAKEVERTDALIRAAGQRDPIYFRAPYGKKLVGLPWYLSKHHRVHVTWDVAPDSANISKSSESIAAETIAAARPGSIVLLHPWYGGRERTRAALDPIIIGLKKKGLELVTVSELLKS
jgi:peptidoglycan-N-acetylglucosamine deacetylase